MYLLWYNKDDDFFSLVKVDGNDDIPAYAILSHTWGRDDDEVTFREVKDTAGVYRRELDAHDMSSHKLISGRNSTTSMSRKRALEALRRKPGYAKIHFCGMQAMRDTTDYFWVDSCCIDRESSAELSESINSMFRWYWNAARCYVHLTDISIDADSRHFVDGQRDWKSAL
jgi:hypothetical protein